MINFVIFRTCMPDLGSDLNHPIEFYQNHTIVSPSWEENHCYGTQMVEKCKKDGGTCETVTNGLFQIFKIIVAHKKFYSVKVFTL